MRKIEEIYINGVCLKEILELHKKWLNGEEDCEEVDLRYANLEDANLEDANLRGANLTGANLRYANLTGANLTGANLRYANLTGANLIGADLEGANLTGANLRGADLRNADLRAADLRRSKIENVKYNELTSSFALVCPEKGSFIGYKKADNKIVKLLITEDAKRSSATSRKCRCSKAKVLSITSVDGLEEYNEVCSDRDRNFIYRVGGIAEVKDFNEDRWNECSTGIHFFITRQEAVNY